MWWLLSAVVCTISGLLFAACFAFAISDYGDSREIYRSNDYYYSDTVCNCKFNCIQQNLWT